MRSTTGQSRLKRRSIESTQVKVMVMSSLTSSGWPSGQRVNPQVNGSNLGLTSFVMSRRRQRVGCEHVRSTGPRSGSGAAWSDGLRENTRTLGFIKRQNDAVQTSYLKPLLAFFFHFPVSSLSKNSAQIFLEREALLSLQKAGDQSPSVVGCRLLSSMPATAFSGRNPENAQN